MNRGQSRTIRVDAQTHADIRDLALLYTHRWQKHVSSADIVRMGLTLVNAHLISSRREVPKEEPRCDPR